MQTQPVLKAGVMGFPIKHSLSPRLHGYWLKHYGIPGSYKAFEVKPQELAGALQGLKDNGLTGVNLTIPHKVAAFAIVNEIDGISRRVGAINLVTVNADGQLLGRNTDAYGFEQNLLSHGYARQGGRAFVLGAGGACRAVLVALQNMGFDEILLSNRTAAHAKRLANELSMANRKISPVEWEKAPALEDVDLLVNTTSLGMTGQPELDISLESLPFSATVTDIVYAPLETGLLRRAHERGNKTIDGLGMLLHQARPSFEAFFGINPEVTDELRRFVLAERN
ncbi:MAG: shikimate dehydrogenase [Alphaproteobacteria bacterium]|nr:shikimate dehydrogenase [Alphaproteobacteria bacterium]